jgi:predicted transposase YbfD/YdcC
MTSHKLALVDLLAQVPDFRQSSVKRYSLVSILSLAVAAMLCGYKTYSAIAEWGRIYGQHIAEALDFKEGKTPCSATFFNILSRLDRQSVEQKLNRWAETLQLQSHEEDICEATSIDGKSLRGSRKQDAPAAHLLSAVGHRLGLTLYQVAVSDKTNEIVAVKQLLDELILKGRVITVDALLTQQAVSQAIVEGEGDYVMVVKENQPRLLAQVKGAIEGIPFYSQPPQQASTLDCQHGRIEERKIITTSVLSDHGLWPGLNQVFKIERRVIKAKSGQETIEQEYGITSLSRERASAEVLLRIVRGHWCIENKSHWVRDVIFDEDRSQVRKGSIPQVMAALRNAAIGLMRWSGERSIATACRRFAAQPWSALALIGIEIPLLRELNRPTSKASPLSVCKTMLLTTSRSLGLIL